jgi:pimeloyl-ACP methyl ester carboxylesterase
MRFKAVWIALLGLLVASSAVAQDLAGNWQGTLQAGNQPLRIIVKIKPAAAGGWSGTIYSIDRGNDWGAGTPTSSFTIQDGHVKFSVDALRGTYVGKLSADANSLEGTWTQRQPLAVTLHRATPESAWQDPATHTIQFVPVDTNVKLEVLDFGGSGKPLVLLTGLGNTAHVFDKFAPKFTAAHHVYAITRRGFGESSMPPDGYNADRLADDVLAVLDALKLDHPALAGHSIGGEELSSIASRHPKRVSGLIYLDAGYPYAFYDTARGDLGLDLLDLRRKLDQLIPGNGPADSRPLIKELLESDLPRFERDLQARQKDLDSTPPALLAAQAQQQPSVPMPSRAIMAGIQKYTQFSAVPILAIYAFPHDIGQMFANDPAERAAREAQDEATTGAQATAFEKAVPSARVVRIPHANHYVFRSNEADVLREMNAFLAGLK